MIRINKEQVLMMIKDESNLKCLHYDKSLIITDNLIQRSNNSRCSQLIRNDQCIYDELCKGDSHCYAFWDIDKTTNLINLHKAGCIPTNEQTNGYNCNAKCVPIEKLQKIYCCCRDTLCNQDLSLNYTRNISYNNTSVINGDINGAHHYVSSPDKIPIDSQISSVSSATTLILSLIILFTLALLSILLIPKWRASRALARQRRDLLNISSFEPVQEQTPKSPVKLEAQLLELIGTGKFGKIYRALMNNNDNEQVAVKIISDRQTYNNELRVFNLPNFTHRNVIKFICSYENHDHNSLDQQSSSANQQQEASLWLVVELCQFGSLFDFLRTDQGDRILSWSVCNRLIIGIVDGLTFLHDNNLTHRDLKSKNILLRTDLSPCITDFGLSVVLDETFDGPNNQRRKYLQVGTPRYMAPEILECSVTFTRSSFAKIDVYSLALIMWELLTRLIMPPYHDSNGKLIEDINSYDVYEVDTERKLLPDPYMLPYENLASGQPSIEEMRHLVVEERVRPPLKTEWSQDPMRLIKSCIEDAWVHDHEARVSSSCIAARLSSSPSLFMAAVAAQSMASNNTTNSITLTPSGDRQATTRF